MYERILKTRASKTTANNSISRDPIKQIPHMTLLVLLHLINCILEYKKFPNALKVKSFEKLMEDFIQEQIVNHFQENYIIPDVLHGGHWGHSTSMAKIVIDKMTAVKR